MLAYHRSLALFYWLLLSAAAVVDAGSQGYPRSAQQRCRLYAAGSRVLSDSMATCDECTRKCAGDRACAGMYHTQIAPWLSSKDLLFAAKLLVVNSPCQQLTLGPNKLCGLWTTGNLDSPSSGAGSCTIFSGKRNTDVDTLLPMSEVPCVPCLTQFLSRPEINAVYWASLPLPGVMDKVDLVLQNGGQATGAEGVVTGAYIPELRAKAVAENLCKQISSKVKSNNFCPATPPPSPPPHQYYRPERPRRRHPLSYAPGRTLLGTNGCEQVTCPSVNAEFQLLLSNPLDCGSFCKCDWGTAYWFACPGPLWFNAELGVCDWPEDSGCVAP